MNQVAVEHARSVDASLDDALWATRGRVMLTGTQALLRLMLMQRARDVDAGMDTRGFISGYRGSPLGAVDQAVWKAGPDFLARGIRFVPAVNEELAATQVLGTQRVESDPLRTTDGVFALWYGKGPGVDRATDALKHGNAYGASPRGGVLVVAGDDHGCVSSSFPHQSEGAMQAMGMPIVAPADIADCLEFGLYGWALSRYSGAWVGMTAPSEVVESRATVDLDRVIASTQTWLDAESVRAASGHVTPPDGLHYRWPDLPSPRIEHRLAAKLDAVAAFARVNSIDRDIVVAPLARVGIVTCGKGHHDLMEVLRRLEIDTAMLAAAGVRIYKVGLAWPLETTRMRAFFEGIDEVLVVEEKAPVVETQLRSLFYNAPRRVAIVGKHDRDGTPLIAETGELRPSRLIEAVAAWLARHFPDNTTFRDHLRHVRDFTVPDILSNVADGVRRAPYFCAGCPHNTSTQVPDGSMAQAGIGCHFMASWMDRETTGLIQMGGEGVDWVSHAMFTRQPHVFQNLGDGTYYHSGYLAIRQAVAAKATLTYKILFNDAVAMTGGQPVDGPISVDAIARQVESEGVAHVAVVSDTIERFRTVRHRFPAGTTFHARADLDAVQRRLRTQSGVTVLIYAQTCAAELRRRRKKGQARDPGRRLFINERVCEGCGDCSVQSNCVAVLPVDTAHGRKRRIDQTTCNKDYSCLRGFCPSFVEVEDATLRRRVGRLAGGTDAFVQRVAALPEPTAHTWSGPYDLLITGVGGTGVVTVGALVAMAAHLEGRSASVLDFMGFAQKGGAVLSFVRLAAEATRLHQVRIDAQQADAVLACDVVVGASPDALYTVRRGRTRILANVHEAPLSTAMRDPDADVHMPELLAKLRHAAGAERVEVFDAQALAEAWLGDTVGANIVALGFAWQRGLVPVGRASLERAIALNGVAVETNHLAFALGRLAAADPMARSALEHDTRNVPAPGARDVDALLAEGVAELTAYQNSAWADRFARTVGRARQREAELGGDGAFAAAVARSLRKLMSYKDEYEVARLYTDGAFQAALAQQFDGSPRFALHMAMPWNRGANPRKTRLGAWVLPWLRVLARGKILRGSPFDPFGRGAERRMERGLIVAFEARVEELLRGLRTENLDLAQAIAAVPLQMRGYGHVKQAAVATARMHRCDPGRYPEAPPTEAGSFRGIRIGTA